MPMSTLAPWWGYSKEHGWVVLDRDLPCNATGIREDLLFYRCRDAQVFFLKWELWKLPEFRYAPNHLRVLDGAVADGARAEYDALLVRWPEIQCELQRQYREIADREGEGTRSKKRSKKAFVEAEEHPASIADQADGD